VDIVIVAVGIDVVLVARFARAIERTPLLVERLFTPAERNTSSGNPRSPESLRGPVRGEGGGGEGPRRAGRPALARLRGGAPIPTAAVAHRVRNRRLGGGRQGACSAWHLSLSHDGGIASAMVGSGSAAS
jgi:holo-[acyl-carrier protein] synthase